MTLLQTMAHEPGPHVVLGETEWHEPVRVPLEYLVNAFSICTGATGSGKTLTILSIIEALLASETANFSFGVLDAKGELFQRTLYLIARRLGELPPARAETLRQSIAIIDLSSSDPITSYNIAYPWSGSDLDFFATSRVEILEELGEGFSLRGGSIVHHVLKLLAEHRLPFSYFDRVLSSEPFRAKLLARSRNEDLRYYFRFHFPNKDGPPLQLYEAGSMQGY
jgi:DNA helicase HerA-like ATPase